jgi:uncharacterized membrane protein YphA (DoxX/SURF4 family)
MKMMSSRRLQILDLAIIGWMARFGPVLLRVSLGIVFLWFGALKFFPHLSPAQELATRTISILTWDLLPPSVSLPLLAAWECLIGLGLLLGRGLRGILLLLYVQMLGTLTPIVLFPNEVFVRIPYAPTLEGQYIIKNLVLISAGIVVGATVRGGWLVPEPSDMSTSDSRRDRQCADNEPYRRSGTWRWRRARCTSRRWSDRSENTSEDGSNHAIAPRPQETEGVRFGYTSVLMDARLENPTRIMRIALGVMATLAGLDKFFNIVADWGNYVSPAAAQLLPFSTDVLMGIVGVVEIAVGIGILTAVPALGAYVASAWLLLVAVNLVIAGHLDIAVRDVVLSIAAFTLARLIQVRGASEVRQAEPGLSLGHVA